MDFVFDKEWKDFLKREFSVFDMEDESLEAVLFVLGVQLLGQGNRAYTKSDKLNLMHIAICTVLEPYGYFVQDGVDKDGWPHFSTVDSLPVLNQLEQERWIKEAIMAYFKRN